VYPTGIPHVLVNGQLVVENGRHTGAMPGQVIRRST
jgi:N-acyl-D-amino-acid deacylase